MLTIFFSAIGAIAGGIVAIPPAWNTLGLPKAATQVFVVEALAKSDATTKVEIDNLKTQLAQQNKDISAVRVDIGTQRRGQIASERFKLEQDLSRAENEGHRLLIRREIDRLSIEDDILESRIKALRQ